MKLYGFPASPNTWKVRAVAHHLGMPLELEFVDLTKGAQRKPEYLALNPTGRTPTLVDGDFKLWESTRSCSTSAARRRRRCGPTTPRHARRHHALAELAPAALEPRSQHPDLREPGQEDHEPRRARPKALAQGTELFHQDAAVLDSHLGATPIW